MTLFWVKQQGLPWLGCPPGAGLCCPGWGVPPGAGLRCPGWGAPPRPASAALGGVSPRAEHSFFHLLSRVLTSLRVCSSLICSGP